MTQALRLCEQAIDIKSIAGSMLRMVENQEQIATVGLVDDLEQQAALERMIERSKPESGNDTDGLHYLLSTPFRYPPLRYGSRYGMRAERSILYASLTEETVLHELAYYQFLIREQAENFKSSQLTSSSQHTLFGADYKTQKGVQLQQPALSNCRGVMTNPACYIKTQAMGSVMRKYGVEAFEFISARDPAGGINVGLLTPAALATKTVTFQRKWICSTGDRVTSFLDEESGSVYHIPVERFLVNGKLPVVKN